MTSEPSPLKSEKYGLAIHTTSPDLGFALCDCTGGSCKESLRHQVWALGREISTHLHVYLAEFLQPQTWADLAFIAVAKGPGGFTGTRIGVVTARTLAQQLDIPLFGISTLAAIAWSERHNLTEPRAAIAVQMPAQRGEVFGAIYQPAGKDLQVLVPDTVMSIDAWKKVLATWNFPYHLIQAESGIGDSVTSLLELAHRQWKTGQYPSWSEVLPFYGQHPVVASKATSG